MWCSCRLSVGKRPLEPRYLLTGSAMCNLPPDTGALGETTFGGGGGGVCGVCGVQCNIMFST